MQVRAAQIREEARLFIATCKGHIQKSNALKADVARLSDEAMILQEECIAEKCKSLAILKLTHQLENFQTGTRNLTSSLNEDAEMIIQMLDEIKRASLDDGNPLSALRTHLFDLSFLPAPE